MRHSNTQLPTASETLHILAQESQRKAARYDFLDMHPELFGVYKQVAERRAIQTSWIEDYRLLELEVLATAVASTTEKMCQYILSSEVEGELLDELFKALTVNDKLERCEAIFVFGSPADMRISHAVNLYQQGLVPLLIVSGKGPHYQQSELSEAERAAQYAISHGVPETAIMIEPESITLPDNVKRTLDMFELQQFKPQKLCVVATSYVMRRAVMEWYKFTPWDIEIMASPAMAQAPELRQESWYQSERGIRMLLNEYAKIVLELKMDLVRRNDD